MKRGVWLRRTLAVFLPVVLLVVGFGGVALMGALKKKPEEKTTEPRGLAVFVEKAEFMPVTLSVKSQGDARPRTEIDIVPQVAGKIVEVNESFVEGGFFTEGEVLLRIDDADYRLAVTRAEATVAQALRGLELQRAEAELAKSDWAELGEGEASALALRQPQLAEAQAQLASARAQLQDAKLQLERTAIRAPFTGRVREKAAGIGQYVAPGQRLGRIFSTDVMQIRLPLSDKEMSLLALPVAYAATTDKPGPKVALSAVVAGDLHHWEGRVKRTDSAIDPTTRTLYTIAEVVDPYGAGADAGVPLPAGLYVQAEIVGKELDDAVKLSRAALRGADTAYVARQDGTLELRTVEVVYSDRDEVVITGGLADGEYVVTSSVLSATTGMKIEAYSHDGELLFPLREEEEDDEGETTDSVEAIAEKDGGSGEKS